MAGPAYTARLAILGIPTDPNKKPNPAQTVDAFEEMETLARAAAAGDVVQVTWAGLDAIDGTREGQPGRVTGADAGTHTDPVVGGTVDNIGEYTWSASPAGWRRTGNLENVPAMRVELEAARGGEASLDARLDKLVVGPASAVDVRIAVFDGTTGKLIKDSGKLLPAGTVVGTTDEQLIDNKTTSDIQFGSTGLMIPNANYVLALLEARAIADDIARLTEETDAFNWKDLRDTVHGLKATYGITASKVSFWDCLDFLHHFGGPSADGTFYNWIDFSKHRCFKQDSVETFGVNQIHYSPEKGWMTPQSMNGNAYLRGPKGSELVKFTQDDATLGMVFSDGYELNQPALYMANGGGDALEGATLAVQPWSISAGGGMTARMNSAGYRGFTGATKTLSGAIGFMALSRNPAVVGKFRVIRPEDDCNIELTETSAAVSTGYMKMLGLWSGGIKMIFGGRFIDVTAQQAFPSLVGI